MEKVYIVYEGRYVPIEWENEFGQDKIVAIYPTEDMARHHLELWVSKMLPVIGTWNDNESKMLKERADSGLDICYDFQPWVQKPIEKENERSFVQDDEEIYCYYSEHDVLREVRLE